MKSKESVIFHLNEDEKIVSVIRRHWLAFLPNIVITSALVLIFIVGAIFVGGSLKSSVENSAAISDNLGGGALIIFGSIYILSVIGFFYISWLDYYLDIFILTNKRIVRFEQIILFGKKVSETSYQHVQDVSSRIQGIINTFFNVGTVFIETAGENENFAFDTIKTPGDMATQILELQRSMWGNEGVKTDLGFENKDRGGKSNILGEEKSALEIDCVKIKGKEFCKIAHTDHADEAKKDVSDQELEKKQDIAMPIIEQKKEKESPLLYDSPASSLDNESYDDGRVVTSFGVIWQADQELTEEVKKVLDEIDMVGGSLDVSDW